MLCDISDISETQIVCVTPPTNGDDIYNSAVDIIVVERLTEESVTKCGGGNTCTFTYDNSITPTVTIPTTRILEEVESQIDYQMLSQIKQITATKNFIWTDHTKNDNPNHLKHMFSKRRNLL